MVFFSIILLVKYHDMFIITLDKRKVRQKFNIDVYIYNNTMYVNKINIFLCSLFLLLGEFCIKYSY